MEDEETQPNQAQPSSEHPFGWEPCFATLIGRWEGGNVMECMNAATNDPHHIQLSVLMDRQLAWDDEKNEWRWHKTWRLPEILVRVNPAPCTNLPPGCGLEVRLNVVCAGNRANELVDVGLAASDGKAFTACLPVVDGECRFARLRLLGTSNTQGGKRFHIVVSVLLRQGGSERYETGVVASLVSSAFTVYSRKDADKRKKKSFTYDLSEEGVSMESFYELFDPEQFTKKFVKKVNDHQGTTTHEPIENSWLGLIRYFQAPNIRFKSKHPLLLGARFSNVLRIMRDGHRYPQEDERTIRELFCACGFPQACNLKGCYSCSTKQSQSTISGLSPLASWMLTFGNRSQMPDEVYGVLAEHMSCVKSPCLGFVADDAALPAHYVPLKNIHFMVDIYCKVYALEYVQSQNQLQQQRPDEGATHSAAAAPTSSPSGTNPPGTATIAGFAAPSTANASFAIGSESHGFRDPGEYDSDSEEHPVHQRQGNTVNMDLTSNSRRSLGQDISGTKARFADYYLNSHNQLRSLLSAFTDSASTLVGSFTPSTLDELHSVYYAFTECVATHSYTYDTLLFPCLTKRLPGVCESYCYDHYRHSDHLTRIYSSLSSVDESSAADLFLLVCGFSAVMEDHIQKEEEHLLPYFMSVVDEKELVWVIEEVGKAGDSQSQAVTGLMNQQQQQQQEPQYGLQYPPAFVNT